jgi:hypothetical protein
VDPLPFWGGRRLSPIELCATYRDQGERATSKPAAITSSPRETPGRARSLLVGAPPGALPTSVHHRGKTFVSSAFDAIAATESSSIVTRQFARWEGLSNRTSSRKVWKSCRRTSSGADASMPSPTGSSSSRSRASGPVSNCSASRLCTSSSLRTRSSSSSDSRSRTRRKRMPSGSSSDSSFRTSRACARSSFSMAR